MTSPGFWRPLHRAFRLLLSQDSFIAAMAVLLSSVGRLRERCGLGWGRGKSGHNTGAQMLWLPPPSPFTPWGGSLGSQGYQN